MKSRVWILSLFLLDGWGCSQPPTFGGFNRGPADSEDLEPEVCKPGRNFRIHESSQVTWQVDKKVENGAETLLIGNNKVSGRLNLRENDWTAVESNISFAHDTSTGDLLRDSRISSFIFGETQNLPLAFDLTSISLQGEPVGGGQPVLVSGIFHLGGIETEVEIPAFIKDSDGMVGITPREIFRLNVRSSTKAKNQINLSEPIRHLLALVPGVDMTDTVAVDFNLTFLPTCTDAGQQSGETEEDPKEEKEPENPMPSGEPTPEEIESEEQTLLRLGSMIYEQRCSSCHQPLAQSNRRGIKAEKITDEYTKNFRLMPA